MCQARLELASIAQKDIAHNIGHLAPHHRAMADFEACLAWR